MPPDHIRDVEAKIGPIEGNNLAFFAIIKDNIETSGESNEEFLKCVVGMSAAHFSSGDIIYPVGSLNDKRYGAARFDEGKVAPLIWDFRELNDAGVMNSAHISIFLDSLAGTPIMTLPGATSFVTTAPAPIIAFLPITTPGKSVTLAPSFAPSSIVGPFICCSL